MTTFAVGRCSAIWRRAQWPGTAPCSALLCAVQCAAAPCSAVQCGSLTHHTSVAAEWRHSDTPGDYLVVTWCHGDYIVVTWCHGDYLVVFWCRWDYLGVTWCHCYYLVVIRYHCDYLVTWDYLVVT